MAVFAQKEGFTPTPSLDFSYEVEVAASVPESATAVGVAIQTDGEIPGDMGVGWDALKAVGFEGKPGQTHAIP